MADNLSFLDATGVARTIRFIEVSSGIWAPAHRLLDAHTIGAAADDADTVLLAGAIHRPVLFGLPTPPGTKERFYVSGNGELYVKHEDAINVTNTGTFLAQAAGVYGSIYTTDGVALTVKYFYEEVAANSANEPVIAAVSGKRLVVTSLNETIGATQTDVTWVSKPAGAGTPIDKHAWRDYGGRVLGFNPHGHFRTAAGEALCLTTSNGSPTYVSGTYIEVS